MSDADVAQLIAAGVLLAVIAALAVVGRTDEVSVAGGAGTRQQKRSWLGAILAGKDHRTSTSKTVVFGSTFAIVLSACCRSWIADRLGDHGPWDAQVDRGLQEEYLLLLGGPFAAAILAKVAAVQQAETKPDAPVGAATPGQLVNDDEGNTDLGDFQYVLFNAIGLAFFFGAFIRDPAEGFPGLPPPSHRPAADIHRRLRSQEADRASDARDHLGGPGVGTGRRHRRQGLRHEPDRARQRFGQRPAGGANRVHRRVARGRDRTRSGARQ